MLELERLFGVRHFETPEHVQGIIHTWARATAVAIDAAGMYTKRFWRGVLVDPKQVWGPTFALDDASNPFTAGESVSRFAVAVLSGLVPAEQWAQADHHLSHASLAYRESPFNSATIISFDGIRSDRCSDPTRAAPRHSRTSCGLRW